MSDEVADAPGELPESSPVPHHPQPATPVPEPKKGLFAGELPRRILSSLVLIPLVLYMIARGGWAYLAAVAIFSLIAQYEFYGLIRGKGADPLVQLGLGFGLAVTLIAYWGNEYHTTLLITASLLVLMLAQLRKAEITDALASISGTFFGVFYVAWLLSHAVLLRFFDRAILAKYDLLDLNSLGLVPDSGAFFMTYVLAVVVACDAGAYFFGRAFGRRKLYPLVSPNKSVEGALGGVVCGALAGVLCKFLYGFLPGNLAAAFPWHLAIGFGFVLSMVGIAGDLIESLLKRDAAVKDTGALLPGMGGMLDRIDAPLLAIPVMYYMLLGWVYFELR